MKNLLIITVFLLLTAAALPQQRSMAEAQRRGETYFRFALENRTELREITNEISIDGIRNDSVYAYANSEELARFLERGIPIAWLPHPGDGSVRTASSIEEAMQFDVYPHYYGYLEMMQKFTDDYPELCRLDTIGQSTFGRELVFAVITSPDTAGYKPRFMYTSSMHGNETAGYVFMLRLIDTLLTSYGADERLTTLVDSVEIWINPLANPDGMFRSDPYTIESPSRYNAKRVDLNRNFPDQRVGDNPDGRDYQPETLAFIKVATENYFLMSANFHSGVEVVSYPWDNFSRLHPDNDWFVFVSELYAHTVIGRSPEHYWREFEGGIINGWTWYPAAGTRQGFMNYYRRGREVTIEVDDLYVLPEDSLDAYWHYNRESILLYMEQCMYGITGVVTDSTGAPVQAEVAVADHDLPDDSSSVFSDPATGRYHRLIYPGEYTLEFRTASDTVVVDSVQVAINKRTILDVMFGEKEPDDTTVTSVSPPAVPAAFALHQNYPNPFNPGTTIGYRLPESAEVTLEVYTSSGEAVRTFREGFRSAGEHAVRFDASGLPSGVYLYRLRAGEYKAVKKMLLIK